MAITIRGSEIIYRLQHKFRTKIYTYRRHLLLKRKGLLIVTTVLLFFLYMFLDNGGLTVSQGTHAQAGDFVIVEKVHPLFDGILENQSQAIIHKHFKNITGVCNSAKRFGNVDEGGYDICMDSLVAPKKNRCLVYSFGIRNEWSFDDAVHDELGCEVHSFDPSMGVKDHQRKKRLFFHNLGIWSKKTVNDKGWNLTSLVDIIDMLGHQNRIIDYIKIDVEGAEWPMLTAMLHQNSPLNIKQMGLEIHTQKYADTKMTLSDYGQTYQIMSDLQNKLDFRLWKETNNNGCCGRFAVLVSKEVADFVIDLCCYELFYINRKYVIEDKVINILT